MPHTTTKRRNLSSENSNLSLSSGSLQSDFETNSHSTSPSSFEGSGQPEKNTASGPDAAPADGVLAPENVQNVLDARFLQATAKASDLLIPRRKLST